MATLVSAVVNGGKPLEGSQRSRVESIRLTFSAPVHLGNGAVQIKLHPSVTVAGVVNQQVGELPGGLVYAPIGDGTAWDISFAGNTEASSIKDGVYQLYRDGGVGDVLLSFHRMFGDNNGSKIVNNTDALAFNNTFNKSQGDPAFNAALDANADGTVDAVDQERFNANFNKGWAY
jgi:hypothetical protein